MKKNKNILIVIGFVVIAAIAACLFLNQERGVSIEAAKHVATKYTKEISVKGLEFEISEPTLVGNWVRFKVVPTNNAGVDETSIYLSRDEERWTVRGFDLPPFGEEDCPKEFCK